MALRMANERTRLVVLTDISSVRAGFKEPDDAQSLIRLLLYSNQFDIEGLIASHSRTWDVVKPEHIVVIINEYAKVRPQLLRHDSNYPSAESLLQLVKEGNPKDGVEEIGEGKDTEASEWIISVVDKEDSRPVWITVWGGTTDLAQALWKVRYERSATLFKLFLEKIRVYSILDQFGKVGVWIREQFPDLFYITSNRAFRGMYRGGDPELVNREWVNRHLIEDHGPLGAAYPNYGSNKPMPKVQGVKEGDTPSFLYLIPNGLGNPMKPGWGSWGGRFMNSPELSPSANHYFDAFDEVEEGELDMATVFRWREAYQASFQARMDWCVKSYEQANHEPVAVVAGESEQVIYSGQTVELSAEGSYDPDGDSLTYEWFFYKDPSTYKGELNIRHKNAERTFFVAPEVEELQTIHVILIVRDQGEPPLTAYRRIIFTVRSNERIEANDY